MRVRRRVAIVAFPICVLVVVGLSPAVAAAAPFPRTKSGTLNCTGAGSLVLSSSITPFDGLKGTTTPVGSPVGGWGRTLGRGAFNPDADLTVALVSKNANANWTLGTVANPASLGLPNPHASCTLSSITGTVIKTVTGGGKTCPTGQTVVIQSSGYTNEGHLWKRSGTTSEFKVKHFGGPTLKFFTTDTGARVLTSFTVRAYAPGNPENPIPSAFLECSADAGTSGTVSWP